MALQRRGAAKARGHIEIVVSLGRVGAKMPEEVVLVPLSVVWGLLAGLLCLFLALAMLRTIHRSSARVMVGYVLMWLPALSLLTLIFRDRSEIAGQVRADSDITGVVMVVAICLAGAMIYGPVGPNRGVAVLILSTAVGAASGLCAYFADSWNLLLYGAMGLVWFVGLLVTVRIGSRIGLDRHRPDPISPAPTNYYDVYNTKDRVYDLDIPVTGD